MGGTQTALGRQVMLCVRRKPAREPAVQGQNLEMPAGVRSCCGLLGNLTPL
jgi:hypothetical protein